MMSDRRLTLIVVLCAVGGGDGGNLALPQSKPRRRLSRRHLDFPQPQEGQERQEGQEGQEGKEAQEEALSVSPRCPTRGRQLDVPSWPA